MTYSKRLALPTTPFKNWKSFYELDGFNFHNKEGIDKIKIYPTTYLSDEVMDILLSHGIKPQFVVLFKDYFQDLNNLPDRAHKRLIHRDIYKNANNEWDKIYCGLNWEMFNDSTWSWWDMSAIPEVPPIEGEENEKFQTERLAKGLQKRWFNGVHYTREEEILWFNGVHYSHANERLELGIHDGAVKLHEDYVLQQAPTLVRTDIPHLVMFHPRAKFRYNVSVRVDEKDIGSWEDALELFRPLYEKRV